MSNITGNILPAEGAIYASENTGGSEIREREAERSSVDDRHLNPSFYV